MFKTTKIEYEDPLKKSGYNVDLKYTNSKLEKTKTQKRNIIRFNPTFSKSISTNVAKTFPHLVTKHFPRSHTLHKISENENAECPMEGNCQVSDEIYKWDVRKSLPKNVYLGHGEGEWKSRFYKHKLLVKDKRYSNKTTLSSYI